MPHFLLFPSPHVLLSFPLLLSSLHYCSLFHTIVFFMMLLFFSLYCSPHRVIVLLFVALLSFSHCLTFLFALLLFFDCFFILGTRFFMLLFSSSHYYVILTMLMLWVCIYSLKNLVPPPVHSFLQELGMVRNRESTTYIFLISIFCSFISIFKILKFHVFYFF
jgi:hypothetical protein